MYLFTKINVYQELLNCMFSMITFNSHFCNDPINCGYCYKVGMAESAILSMYICHYIGIRATSLIMAG